MCSALMRVGLLLVEPGRVGVDVDDVEGGHHLVEAEHVAIVGDPPAEQRQIVQQALGDEAAVAVQEQVGLRVALGQLLVAVAENGWQMRELGHALGDADADQRLVQRDLARRRRQQVLAAQHVGDLHQRVVDRIDQGVQRVSAGAGQREVGHRCRPRTSSRRAPGRSSVMSSSGIRRRSTGLAALGAERGALLVGEVAVEVVVAELRVAAGGEVPGLDLLGRRVRLVGLARGRAAARARRGRCRGAATAGRARTGRRPPGPRPSSGRASAARPAAPR